MPTTSFVPGKIAGASSSASNIAFRRYADSSSTILANLHNDDFVEVEVNDSTGAKILYNGGTMNKVTSEEHNDGKPGYVTAKYVKVVGGGTGGGGSGQVYNRTTALSYAMTYTNNIDKSTINYHSGFSVNQDNDCANFVSQCLLAGGIGMDGTWYYDPGKSPMISGAWNTTYALRNSLISRQIAVDETDWSKLNAGDLVFTYDKDGIKNGGGSNYTHVTILTRKPTSSTVYVSGHTKNQLDTVKKNDDDRNKAVHNRYLRIIC